MMQAKFFVMAALFFLTCIPQASALEPEEDLKAKTEQEQESPTLEFLEFLGEWETEEGDWIAPEDLENMPLSEKENDETKNK
ncbi:MAG: hypothetical protein HOK41_12125 [Nitrospina sp.]|jgi:hypothetical protein|nr:hypothetical protein [Nitrospina sp.]MBT6718652.1 hypothetical protein [Nitrospina sp.]